MVEIPGGYADVDCPSCGEPIGTNPQCLGCLYCYEALALSESDTNSEDSA